MLAALPSERCKSNIFAGGGFLEDQRIQMGRTASAHSAQRMTMLICHILQEVVFKEKWDGGTTAQKK